MIKNSHYVFILIIYIAFLSGCRPSAEYPRMNEVDGVKLNLLEAISEPLQSQISSYYKSLPAILKEKDAEKMISYFSKDFLGPNSETYEKIKEQLPLQYEKATEIQYEASNITVYKKGSLIVSQNDFTTTVSRVDNSKDSLSGQEQIFWIQESSRLKIIHWEKL